MAHIPLDTLEFGVADYPEPMDWSDNRDFSRWLHPFLLVPRDATVFLGYTTAPDEPVFLTLQINDGPHHALSAEDARRCLGVLRRFGLDTPPRQGCTAQLCLALEHGIREQALIDPPVW